MQFEGMAIRLRGPAHEATDATKWATPGCRHPRRIPVAARGVVPELRALVNQATWTTVKATFREETRNPDQEAAVTARVASDTESEERGNPTWRPEGEFNPKMALDVVNSCNALSGARSDDLCFSQLQPTIRTQFGL